MHGQIRSECLGELQTRRSACCSIRPIFLFAFLPATVGLYVLLRQFAGPRAVLGLLLSASLLFYAWWNPLYLPLLGGIAVFNFIVARWITAQRRPAGPVGFACC